MKIWGLNKLHEKFSGLATSVETPVVEVDEQALPAVTAGEFAPDALQLETAKNHALLHAYANAGQAFIPDAEMPAADIDETDIYATEKPASRAAIAFERVKDAIRTAGKKMTFPGYTAPAQFLPTFKPKR